jgi:hypothetical protein
VAVGVTRFLREIEDFRIFVIAAGLERRVHPHPKAPENSWGWRCRRGLTGRDTFKQRVTQASEEQRDVSG